MARDHARVNVTIWGDPEFRKLPPAAQYLYLTLWTSPQLSYCGVHDWRPARLSGLAEGWTREAINAAADCLQARHFLVIDHDTEEVLIRSWIRWDGLMKQPRMAISCITAYSAVYSDTLRQVIVHQLLGEQEREPDLKCWTDKRVQEVLTHPEVSAKSLPTPDDPFRDGLTPRFGDGFGIGLDQTQGKVSVPPTPAPAPAPLLRLPDEDKSSSVEAPDKSDAPKRASKMSKNWTPTDEHRERASASGLNCDQEAVKFRAHAEEKGRTAKNWNAAFTRWLIQAEEYAQRDGRPSGRTQGTSLWDRVPNVTQQRLARSREEGA